MWFGMSDDIVREFLAQGNENLDSLDREFESAAAAGIPRRVRCGSSFRAGIFDGRSHVPSSESVAVHAPAGGLRREPERRAKASAWWLTK